MRDQSNKPAIVRLPTLEEVRAKRLTVTLTYDQGEADTSPSTGRLFTEAEVIAAQASEGELIGKALRADLEQERAELRKTRAAYEAAEKARNELAWRVKELERELGDAEQSAAQFKTQAYAENDRAAALTAQLRRTEDRHQRELAALRADLERASASHQATIRELNQAREIIDGTELSVTLDVVDAALAEVYWSSTHDPRTVLGRAVHATRQAIKTYREAPPASPNTEA